MITSVTIEINTMWDIGKVLLLVLTWIGLCLLWRGAPGLQKLVIFLLAVSIPGFAVIDVMRAFSIEVSGEFLLSLWELASTPMQFAIMITVFRLWQKEQESQCPRSDSKL